MTQPRTRTTDHRRKLLTWARYRAKKKGLEFDLELDDLVIPSHCPLLGIPMKPGQGVPTDYSPTLDRTDPTKGYVKGNVLVISNLANRIKSTATLPQLMRVTAFVQQLVD